MPMVNNFSTTLTEWGSLRAQTTKTTKAISTRKERRVIENYRPCKQKPRTTSDNQGQIMNGTHSRPGVTPLLGKLACARHSLFLYRVTRKAIVLMALCSGSLESIFSLEDSHKLNNLFLITKRERQGILG